jgi:hypothetical protein
MRLIQQIQQKRAEVTEALLQWLRQTRARTIFRLLAMRGRIAPLWVRHGWNLIPLIILIFAGASFALLPQSDSYVFVPRSDSTILAYLADAETIQTVRTILTTVGGALIGSAVIGFSLVMFAMQVNVERMPHGLFFRFSSDKRIMLLFVGTFVIALVVVACALMPRDPYSAALAILMAGWGVVLTFLLIFAAYRRALFLINPVKQLEYVLLSATRNLRTWSRRATFARPLLEVDAAATEEPAASRHEDPSHDLPRMQFFSVNPHWTHEASRAVTYAISYANRYAEEGDHQVSEQALGVVAAINSAYVQAKGKTFFASNFLIDTPLSTDGFINETLEHLRQMVRRAATRNDEEQMEQALGALANLVAVYVRIDYGQQRASLTHAQLAAGYLSGAVKSLVPANVPDVLMQGLRRMGGATLQFVMRRSPVSATSLVEEIAVISAAGIAKENYRPVTMIGIEQLARLTLALLQTDRLDIDFTLKKLKENVSFVAKMVLLLPDSPLASVHSQTLGSYYSVTSSEALHSWLAKLCNVVGSAAPDHEKAQSVTRNVHDWGKELYRSERELLLLAIEKRSHFAHEMILWISHVADILLAVSNAPACAPDTARDLRTDANRLISVLSFIPDDQETMSFVANFNMAEVLFEAICMGAQRGCPEFEASAQDMLLKWGFRAGRHHVGWGGMEESVYGLAAAHLLWEPTPEKRAALLGKIRALLDRPDGPDQDMRDRSARSIRERAESYFDRGFSLSRLEHAMSQVDDTELSDLLSEIASAISPGTAAEPMLPHLV